MLSMINFFHGFCVDNSGDKVRSDKIIRSNLVYQYAIDMKS